MEGCHDQNTKHYMLCDLGITAHPHVVQAMIAQVGKQSLRSGTSFVYLRFNFREGFVFAAALVAVNDRRQPGVSRKLADSRRIIRRIFELNTSDEPFEASLRQRDVALAVVHAGRRKIGTPRAHRPWRHRHAAYILSTSP